MKTIDNDGSVAEDPCQACSGKLVLRRAPTGGFFLGCTFYSRGCTFKMGPNAEEMERLDTERAERKAARVVKRAERDAAIAKKDAERERRKPPAPQYCSACYSALSNVDVQAKKARHGWC